LAFLPATNLTLALYLVHALNTKATVSAINLTCSAVAFAHRMTGEASPTNGPFTLQVREFAKRHGLRPTRTKEPVSLHQVHNMARHFLESTVPAEYQKGLIPLLMFAAFLRYSDLISLQWNDIQFEGAAMWLLIPYSKTDQEGKGMWIPVAALAGPYCAGTSLAARQIAFISNHQELMPRGLEEGGTRRHAHRNTLIPQGRSNSSSSFRHP
ncbi:unnamed protein product, partial [Closterium sp. NIES-53]